MSARYALDKSNAKLMGVCSGIARSADVDVTLVRIAAILLTLFALGPVALLAYVLVGLIANAG
jgi:phage shock protein C